MTVVPVRRDGLHGRRKGKPLSPRRAGLMTTLLPSLLIDLDRAPPADAASLFPHRPQRVVLEIGFGGAEHFIAAAAREPDAGFIGVEPFVNGLAKAVTAVDEQRLANVRLFGDDAALLLDWLPAGSLSAVDLLYPDPWPKRRHWKRRFVSPANLDRLARALASGGAFRFASDSADYVAWTLALLLPREDFSWTATRADDWRRPFPGWTGTRYERKAVAAGRRPTYLAIVRR